MSKNTAKIKDVIKGSIAEELQIEHGDELLLINDTKVTDILEYKYLINEEFLTLTVRKSNGEVWDFEVEKDYEEDLGIIFEKPLIDNEKSCQNKCIFCFIDQLPKEVRKSVYFKDDDYRLSFLEGNYVSLTNVSNEEIDKIIKYRISPINVSVHTTDPELRVKMLNNKHAGDIFTKLKKLSEGGIVLNCQIVVCPGYNDKENLIKTINHLSTLYPNIHSIAAVPVGLTSYREGLTLISPFNKESSNELINQVEKLQDMFLKRIGTRLIYIADEFYLMAQKSIPQYKEYEGFPQIENGVGMISLFQKQFDDYFKRIEKKNRTVVNREVSIATGVSAFDFISSLCKRISAKYNIKINVYKIINDYFGHNITVAGLITGSDIIKQLKEKNLGEVLFISQCMLKSNEDIFLDDTTLKELEEELNIKVMVSANNGKDFINNILGW